MIVQRVFTKSNIDKIYLSPYVLTSVDGNNLVITREERKKIIKLTTKDSPMLILKCLNEGIEPDNFLKILSEQLIVNENDAKSVLQLLVSEKIID